MARRLEERLAAIERIAGSPGAAEVAELRAALAGKTGLLVAAAARVVGELALEPLVEALPGAFANLLERPVERDPGCRGKVQIARTLIQLERWSEAVFARGAAHVQREPVWGGSEDTAAELRGLCGIAHARMARHDALEVLAQLLADPERATRAAAAHGLGDSGRPDAIPLLRYKAIIGDPEPAVLAACLASLLALEPEASVPFVAGFLAAGGERAEIAAIALGESRRESALPALLAWCDGATGEPRAVGFLALALLRLEPATAHLVGLVEHAEPADAIAAARALATFRDDPALAGRVAAAGARRDAATRRAIRELFPG
ncbi:MAG TPA: HEAT repeat domain-containing protein [Kofleriaceae bacterium]|nr:HEAT repeat domain-containing protein [Kofleriaceae bacterium]